jgi:hypothetical protein
MRRDVRRQLPFSTISKLREALLGHVSRGILTTETCNNGHATVLQERLPWHIRYRGFEGALPNIAAVGYALIGEAVRSKSNSSVSHVYFSPPRRTQSCGGHASKEPDRRRHKPRTRRDHRHTAHRRIRIVWRSTHRQSRRQTRY